MYFRALHTCDDYVDNTLHIPNAQLIICPGSGHGSPFQDPALFLAHARLFLDSRSAVITIGGTSHRLTNRKEKRNGAR